MHTAGLHSHHPDDAGCGTMIPGNTNPENFATMKPAFPVRVATDPLFPLKYLKLCCSDDYQY